MELWESDDRERPIETYPGYLGLSYDGSIDLQPELAALEDFDFQEYNNFVEGNGRRQLSVALSSGTFSIVLEDSADISNILDQLPTVKVYLDNGPPDAGPASGGICLFFIADGTSEDELKVSIAALATALKLDLAALQNNS